MDFFLSWIFFSPTSQMAPSRHQFSLRQHTWTYTSSHHPLSHKTAVIRTLFTHAGCLSSSLVKRSAEEAHVSKALRGNGYPARLIRRSAAHLSHRKPTSHISPPLSPPKVTVTLPYIQGLSESIRRVLGGLDIRVCFRPKHTLCQLLVKPRPCTSRPCE